MRKVFTNELDEYSSMIFNVQITEIRSRVVQIEAQTDEGAIAQAEEKYLTGEITLNSDDDFEEAKYMVVS